jgi:hypothetical protein
VIDLTDISFPIHPLDSNTYKRQQVYNEFMKQCRESLGYLCDESEKTRMEANLFQPSRMKVTLFHNYGNLILQLCIYS